MEKNNSTCCICGKGYYLCLACNNNRLTPWKIHTDTSEHFKIFQILRSYNCGVINKDEAKKMFENVDLSDFDELTDRVKSQINAIIAEDIIHNNDEFDVKEQIVLENDVEDSVIDIEDSVIVEQHKKENLSTNEKPRKKRK